jgi:uncharacterized protein
MKSPCEEVVWDILPSIRAAVAAELVKSGLSQKAVSKMLGITPPAVSQYVSKKRGSNMVFDEETSQAIAKLSDDLISNNVDDLVVRICQICRDARGGEPACKPRCKCNDDAL